MTNYTVAKVWIFHCIIQPTYPLQLVRLRSLHYCRPGLIILTRK